MTERNTNEYIDYADMEMNRLTEIVQERYWEEYREYISEVPMSAYERRLLRKWVSDGHSVYDDPGSRYLPDSCYPRPFLDVYREDRDIAKALWGKPLEERVIWMQQYQGYIEPTKKGLAMEAAREATPELIRDQIRDIRRELAHLWEFVWSEGLGEEARVFVEDRRDQETPFEW